MNDDSIHGIHHDKKFLNKRPGSQYAYSVKYTRRSTLSLTHIFVFNFRNNEAIIAIFTKI